MLLVDACREVPKDAGRGAKGIQGRVIALPEDTAVLFSCRAGQRSFESEELKQGVFTHCVLDGLRGRAATEGEITWSDLVPTFRVACTVLIFADMPMTYRNPFLPVAWHTRSWDGSPKLA